VALTTGDYFVVSVDGTNAVLGTLEVGDLIFANNDIPSNDSPAIGNYTVVRQDANIAGAGATDGATEKGVSGFDSAFFDVSASGWVQIKSNGIPLGTNTSGNYTESVAASTAIELKGIAIDGAASAGQDAVVGLDITGQTSVGSSVADADEFLVYDASAAENKKVAYSAIASSVHDSGKYTDTFPNTVTNTWIVTHSLGTVNVLVQAWINATGQAVYIDFVRTDANNVTFTASANQAVDTIRVLVTK